MKDMVIAQVRSMAAVQDGVVVSDQMRDLPRRARARLLAEAGPARSAIRGV
ncbi:MAG TPA: hypothetical protein VG435_01960 [Acidimicrobiales bacterium]|jgi:hypothetical protein|nr:hypothetical protein [Acidimicrobiales bacterium]